MMLCAYNPKQQTASMLSIPRDTFVGTDPSKNRGSDKINYLYTVSPEKVMNKVSEITGIDVAYYVVINTKALIEVVDIIGGVEFDVPIDMKYDDPTQNLHINLKKGMQKIDGVKAEQLLRFRHNNDGSSYPVSYGDNDYGRMRTQREFISETVKQTIQFKNITKIGSLINGVFDNVETNLELNQILDYLPYTVNFNTEDIDSQQLPGKSDNPYGVWFFFHDKKETESLMREMKDRIEGIQEDLENEENIVNETMNNTNIENTSKK